jgi:hypothetical protein
MKTLKRWQIYILVTLLITLVGGCFLISALVIANWQLIKLASIATWKYFEKNPEGMPLITLLIKVYEYSISHLIPANEAEAIEAMVEQAIKFLLIFPLLLVLILWDRIHRRV